MAINPINVNTQGIGSAYNFNGKAKSSETENKEAEAASVNSNEKTLSADDVFSYLAQSAVSVKPASAKTVDPSKYVDSASASRIEDSMAQFEAAFNANIGTIAGEFPEMSDGAKQTLALAQINAQV